MRRRDAIINAGEYLRSINNRDKRAYAYAYNDYKRYGGSEPERPAGLSFLGSQAVRMRLDAIWIDDHA